MSSKVKCTCGWSWNKSDSSKKDMYVCHECGRDNSNNMKNGGWLDNYGEEENANESSVSLPDGYVGMGNDTQGRKSSPAWGGQFQSGGELLQSKESTSVNKKPFNKKELQNIIKDETERTRTGYVKNYRAEANKIEKFLPTKETVDFFNKIKKDAGPELFTALLNIQNKQGNPSINVGTNKGLPFHNRKNYNPFTNEVNIPNSPEILDDIYNYLSEVSHANQSLSEVIPKFLKNDIPGYLKAFTSKGETSENVQKYVYDNPNTVENYTHGKIEPSLINQIENYDYSNHWPISKEEESREYNLIENKLKSGNKNLQMGGSIPGAVGFSYARTNSPAPSEGKYAKKTMASAQDGSKVKYGTPEYEEAYNKGEVLSSTGERSPITLDEVTVQNTYKKDKNWLEQYADKITEENKDAGVMGAIFGTPLSAVTSLPQMFATKSITGEMQRPSEAMNIQNPYGAMAVDAVLDPANLVGAGLLTKEKALSRIAASKESGVLSNAYKLNRNSFKTNSNNFYRQVDNTTYNEGLESGIIKRKQEIGNRGVKGIDINLNKSFGDDAYYNKGSLYYKDNKNLPYLFEANLPEEKFIPKVNGRTRKYTTENTSVRVSKEPVSINDPNIKKYKKDWLQGYKEVPKKEDGGVIKDDRGQWDHPGEITEIGSNDITMEGVPYDVLGISDTGDAKLMKPGKNYKFKGKKVTEYPMAKNGMRQEQKGLQNLDNLTNFTNYNTKQPGGWLDQFN
jgi:hypothetical protein